MSVLLQVRQSWNPVSKYENIFTTSCHTLTISCSRLFLLSGFFCFVFSSVFALRDQEEMLGFFFCSQNFLQLNTSRILREVIEFVPQSHNYPSVVHVLQTTKNWVNSRRCFHRARKKCTKNYYARAQLLFCSLNLLFSEAPLVASLVTVIMAKYTSRRNYSVLFWENLS